MKTFMIAPLLFVSAPIVFAQGAFTGCLIFYNGCQFQTPDPTGGNRLVYDVGSPLDPVGGVKISGTQFVAELYAGADAASMQPLTATISRFRTSTTTSKGRWASTTISGQGDCVPIPGPVGSTATLQVKVWDQRQFPTYEQALGHGLTGASTRFQYTIPPANAPADCMEGLQAFALVGVQSILRISSANITGTNLTLHFIADAASTYTVQYRDAFDAGHPWTKLVNVSAPVSTGDYYYTANDSPLPGQSRVYRIVTPAE